MLQKNIEPTVFVKLTVLSFAFSFNVFIWIYELQKNPDCFNHYLHSYKSLHSNQRTDLKFLTSGTCLETGSLEQISSESPMGSWNFWQILKVPLLICHKNRSKWNSKMRLLQNWEISKIISNHLHYEIRSFENLRLYLTIQCLFLVPIAIWKCSVCKRSCFFVSATYFQIFKKGQRSL